jgi:sterol desaturase/sphingolipid hydroxylase (fatty acid hydroxylase superfamily)
MYTQDMTDSRPAGVRVALRQMSRLSAVTVTGCLGCVALAGVAGAFLDQTNVLVWGVLGLAGAFAAFHYISAIRWSDHHKAWPHRRSHRRRRAPSK